jgi:hypothetical protein
MQIHRKKAGNPSTWAITLALLFCVVNQEARAQDAVSFLRADLPENLELSSVEGLQHFSFDRNLIFFIAHLNGEAGNYILDTGSPTLLLNVRNEEKSSTSSYGIAAGGTVALTNYKVKSFEMAGKKLGQRWALATDLRAMEARTGKTIDGYVGYDLIRSGELRINYGEEFFYLRKSVRKPRNAGRLPDHVFRFTYHDHLPVITLKVNGKKLRFAIDTGSGVNLLDKRLADKEQLAIRSERQINVQGLDGFEAVYNIVRLQTPDGLANCAGQIDCVSMDLNHLQTGPTRTISGILGSSFLSSYTVGIDYRRRKLYLWKPSAKH